MEYYIFVTDDDNLYCEYCNVLVNPNQNILEGLPNYKLENILNYIEKKQEKYNEERVDIIFLAGETIKDYKYMSSFINLQKANSPTLDFHYMLHTNGLLLAKIPLLILSNLESILLTIHCSKVPQENFEEGFFRQIVNSIYKVKRSKNIPIIGKFMIAEQHNLYNEIMLFHPFFDAICWQIENNKSFINYESFYLSYKDNVTQLMELWIKYLEEGIVLKFIPFISSICYLNNNQYPINFSCGNPNKKVYIKTNSRCFICDENSLTEESINNDLSEKFIFNKLSLRNVECHTCCYINICNGYCGKIYNEYTTSHVKEYCELNKILFNLFEQNMDIINNACKKHQLNLSISDSIYHCT